MAVDVVLLPVSSGYNVSVINDNFEAIETALADAVSRSGESPNQFTAALDMNGNDLLNVGALGVEELVYQGDEVPVINVKYEGEWDVGDTYGYNYLVRYDGDIYRALRTTVGDQPNTSALDWELWLEAGEDGVNGSDGALSGVEEIKTGTYNVVAGDSGKILVANSGSPLTFNFAAVASLGGEFVVFIKNIGAGTLTLDPNGSETIDGATTKDITQNKSCVVNCNGSVLKTYFLDVDYSLPTATTSTLGGLTIATAAEVRTAAVDKIMTPLNVKDSAAFVSATYGSTITLDHRDGFHRTITLTGSPTIANPTNVVVGFPLVLSLIQDGTGNREPSWGSNFKFGGATVDLTNTASAEDILFFFAKSATQIVYLGIVKGIQ